MGRQSSARIAEPEDQQEVRTLVREILGKVATAQRLAEFDEREAFDEDLYVSLAEAGLVRLEGDLDGTRPSHLSETVVLEELGATATSMGVSFVVQYMGVSLLSRHGTDTQRRQVLEPLFDGSKRVAFALTEPDGGTDVARVMRTRATRNDDGAWRIRGGKMWISGATDCSDLIVLARTDEAETSAINGITMFLVPRDSDGLKVSAMDTVAIHGLDTCEVQFDDVTVPEDAVLGEPGLGFRQVLSTLNGERLNAAAVALGIARGAHEYAVEYARERHAFGRPIGGFQSLQHRLVDDAIAIEAARGLLQRAATEADQGGAAEALSAMAKVAASDAATSAADTGMRVMAGAGLSRETPMQRYFRDARLYTFAPLTDEMLRNFIGEQYLKLPRSY